MLTKWWQRWPGLLKRELRGLKAGGIQYKLDHKTFRKLGVIKSETRHRISGKDHRLEVVYPDLYPFFRFEVYAPDDNLGRHQNFFEKNLCLIGRDSTNWSVRDSFSKIADTQLEKVFSDDPDFVARHEEPQGEPFSNNYSYQPFSQILIDSAWTPDRKDREGKLILSGDLSTASGTEGKTAIFRGVVVSFENKNGKGFDGFGPEISNLYTSRFEGRWYRVDKPIEEKDPKLFLRELETIFKQSKHPKWNSTGNKSRIAISAVIFPEELTHKKIGDGWVFLLQIQKGRNWEEEGPFYVRAGRFGKTDVLARIPELASFPQKKVAVIGLGSIGAPTAIEFARSGVGELRVLDHDYIDAGSIARWPLGVSYIGFPKPDAIELFIKTNFPYTKVIPFRHRIGATRDKEWQKSDLEVLEQLVEGLDLVFDATAEVGVQHFLSDLCRNKGIPYVCAATKQGAWGGAVARIVPEAGKGCWVCYRHWVFDKTIDTPVAAPAFSGNVQPQGCAETTFTGASFDISQIVLSAIQLAIGTLCSGHPAAYPNPSWDIGVLALRDEQGNLIPPTTAVRLTLE